MGVGNARTKEVGKVVTEGRESQEGSGKEDEEYSTGRSEKMAEGGRRKKMRERQRNDKMAADERGNKTVADKEKNKAEIRRGNKMVEGGWYQYCYSVLEEKMVIVE